MYDSLIALTDLVTNYWSMGLRTKDTPLLLDGFRAADGWFVVQVGRPYQFQRLAEIVGRPEWIEDERLRTGPQWREHLEDLLRPGIEAWAADKSKLDACRLLTAAGVAAGPCYDAADVIADPHVAARHMLVEIPRTDGVPDPVLVPGNPVKLSSVAEGPDRRPPWLGEHTADVLTELLGLDDVRARRARRRRCDQPVVTGRLTQPRTVLVWSRTARVVVDLPRRMASQGLLEGDASFHPGQGGAEAEVDPVAERHVVVEPAVDVEAVRVGVLPLVAAGGAGQQQHLLVGGDGGAVQLDGARRPAPLHR